jgi:hypothetical protein
MSEEKTLMERARASATPKKTGKATLRRPAGTSNMARPKLIDVDLRRVPRRAFRMVTR